MAESELKVLPVSLGHVHAYLCHGAAGPVLIDAGIPGSEKKILRAILSAGISVQDLKLIAVTHGHYDHVGALAVMQAVSGAPVLASRVETEYLRDGRTPFPKGTNPFARFVSGLSRTFAGSRRQFKPVTADIAIDSELDLKAYGLSGRALPLPGHSAGSLGIILDSGEAFVGDAAFNIFPRSVVPPLADDPAALMESWKILIDSGAHTFYPGHGAPFSREKLIQSLPLLEKLVRRSNR